MGIETLPGETIVSYFVRRISEAGRRETDLCGTFEGATIIVSGKTTIEQALDAWRAVKGNRLS